MSTPITVSVPHQLGRAEARRRIETGFAKIIHLLPGSSGACSERRDGDRLTFGIDGTAVADEGIASILG